LTLASCGGLEKDGWRVTYPHNYIEGVVRIEDFRIAGDSIAIYYFGYKIFFDHKFVTLAVEGCVDELAGQFSRTLD